jgi:carbon monoxide dehydrogenase subunit G
MGKVDFVSQTVTLPVTAKKAFGFLSDMNNLQKMMPEQVINWQSTEETCSFDIKGMAHIELVRAEAIPDRLVRIKSGEGNPIDLEFRSLLESHEEDKTLARIELTAELSPMLKLMASNPLQNLVNIMAEKMTSAF